MKNIDYWPKQPNLESPSILKKKKNMSFLYEKMKKFSLETPVVHRNTI